MASAQADFRSNDRDGNGVNDFWRDDIAGLYAVRLGGVPIQLIMLGLAAADKCPAVDIASHTIAGPYSSHWFKAIRHAGEEEKVDRAARFAACAWPDIPSAGKYVYVIDQRNTIYRKAGTAPVDAFPTDAELDRSWHRLD